MPAHTEAFRRFHRENPWVYWKFSQFAWQAVHAGHKHYSADAIMHRVRWHTEVEGNPSAFKINNNFVAHYARLFMELNPTLRGFFRTRLSREED